MRGPAQTLTNDALRQVIDYYLYRDLQRGWRWTLPNLEDGDLLIFDYVGLTGPDGLLAETEVWGNRIDGIGGQNGDLRAYAADRASVSL